MAPMMSSRRRDAKNRGLGQTYHGITCCLDCLTHARYTSRPPHCAPANGSATTVRQRHQLHVQHVLDAQQERHVRV